VRGGAQVFLGVADMEVKEAVVRAKDYVREVFADESISNLGLDEVVYDDFSNTWDITIGFSRPWSAPHSVSSYGAAFSKLIQDISVQPLKRSFKIVKIDDTGKILSLKNRPREDGTE
jgi:hypothetical protein